MDVMRDNIGKVLQRGEKLDDLEEKSDHLVAGATEFRRSSHKMQKQMWWQSCKVWLIMAVGLWLKCVHVIEPLFCFIDKALSGWCCCSYYPGDTSAHYS
jgi:vesicle-associated membrane protein 4